MNIEERPTERRREIACAELALTLQDSVRVLLRPNALVAPDGQPGHYLRAVRPHEFIEPGIISGFADVFPGCRMPEGDWTCVIEASCWHADHPVAAHVVHRPGVVCGGVGFGIGLSLFEEPGGLVVRVVDDVSGLAHVVFDNEMPETVALAACPTGNGGAGSPETGFSGDTLDAALARLAWFALPSLAALLRSA